MVTSTSVPAFDAYRAYIFSRSTKGVPASDAIVGSTIMSFVPGSAAAPWGAGSLSQVRDDPLHLRNTDPDDFPARGSVVKEQNLTVAESKRHLPTARPIGNSARFPLAAIE